MKNVRIYKPIKLNAADGTLDEVPVDYGQGGLVGLRLSAAAPVHVWLSVNDYQVESEYYHKGHNRGDVVDQKHYGHASYESEQRQPCVVVLKE